MLMLMSRALPRALLRFAVIYALDDVDVIAVAAAADTPFTRCSASAPTMPFTFRRAICLLPLMLML